MIVHEWETAIEHRAEFFAPDFMVRMIIAFSLAPVETIIPEKIGTPFEKRVCEVLIFTLR